MCDNNCDCSELAELLEELTKRCLEQVDVINRQDIIIDDYEIKLNSLIELTENLKGGM